MRHQSISYTRFYRGFATSFLESRLRSLEKAMKLTAVEMHDPAWPKQLEALITVLTERRNEKKGQTS
jgi:hypothetical protein